MRGGPWAADKLWASISARESLLLQGKREEKRNGEKEGKRRRKEEETAASAGRGRALLARALRGAEEMWRRRLGALLLRSPPSSSSAAASSCQHHRHHLLPSEEPLALNRLARLFTSQAGSDGGNSQKPFIAFVLGGPGSGKGTQCTKIASDFGFAHLSAGDLLRHEIASGSEKGELILDIIKEGRIVPSEITVELIRKAMETCSANKVLIDGFPRCEENRITFERIVGREPDIVVFFDCPEDEMVKRLLGRNQGRVDDNIETIKKRLKVFESLNIPVVDYYSSRGKVCKINATGTADEIFEVVRKLFSSLRF